MIHTQHLEDAIKESGLRTNFICEKLGITRQAFRLKVIGKRRFRLPEIHVLAELLNLSAKQVDYIFFDVKGE